MCVPHPIDLGLASSPLISRPFSGAMYVSFLLLVLELSIGFYDLHCAINSLKSYVWYDSIFSHLLARFRFRFKDDLLPRIKDFKMLRSLLFHLRSLAKRSR